MFSITMKSSKISTTPFVFNRYMYCFLKMSPASPFNMWANPSQDAKITINCLMPNSILIPLDVMSNAVLSELKEELWEEARKYPLQGLLKEQSSYNFMCVNCMAERETLIDESRRRLTPRR
jgi:hypothetical protein